METFDAPLRNEQTLSPTQQAAEDPRDLQSLEVTRPADDRQGGCRVSGISSPPNHSVEQTGTGGRSEGDGRPVSFERSRSKAANDVA
jgi:hypothetical protein